jgi:hypothetical protein
MHGEHAVDRSSRILKSSRRLDSLYLSCHWPEGVPESEERLGADYPAKLGNSTGLRRPRAGH